MTLNVLTRLLRSRGSLVRGMGFLGFLVTAGITRLYFGLPIDEATMFGFAGGMATAAIMADIDTRLGLSEATKRSQENREWQRLEQDIQEGRISLFQVLHRRVQKQLAEELQELPWYTHLFRARRRRVEKAAENRHWIIDHVLTRTLPPTGRILLSDAFKHFYEVEAIIFRLQEPNQLLPSGQEARTLSDAVLRELPSAPFNNAT